MATDNAHQRAAKGREMNELIAVQKIAGWEKLKSLVLDSVSSPITKRVYNMALNEFLAWFQQAPRPGFTKANVSARRVSLEDRAVGSRPLSLRVSNAISGAGRISQHPAYEQSQSRHGIITKDELSIHRRLRRNPCKPRANMPRKVPACGCQISRKA